MLRRSTKYFYYIFIAFTLPYSTICYRKLFIITIKMDYLQTCCNFQIFGSEHIEIWNWKRETCFLNTWGARLMCWSILWFTLQHCRKWIAKHVYKFWSMRKECEKFKFTLHWSNIQHKCGNMITLVQNGNINVWTFGSYWKGASLSCYHQLNLYILICLCENKLYRNGICFRQTAILVNNFIIFLMWWN